MAAGRSHHAAEQTKEVADCIAALKATPVAWLLDNANVDGRWCLIHATHMTEGETRGCGVGRGGRLVPIDRSLARRRHLQRRRVFLDHGRFGVGTDSNIQIGAAAELRMLEYSQRLRRHTRNVFARGRVDRYADLSGGVQGWRASARARHRRD